MVMCIWKKMNIRIRKYNLEKKNEIDGLYLIFFFLGYCLRLNCYLIYVDV